MHQPTQLHDPYNTVTYYVTPRHRRRRYIAAALGALLCGGVLPLLLLRDTLAGTSNIVPTVAAVALLMLVSACWLWRAQQWAQQTSLSVSTQTLVYQTPGLVIQTDWCNIAAVVEGFDPRRGYLALPHLSLQQRAAVRMSRFVRLQRWISTYQWNMDCRIPLDVFGWHKQSDLHVTLQRLAPHLFHDDQD